MADHVNCRDALAHLQDYLKRELTAELAEEVRSHLEHCRPCFKHARFEENFLLMLGTRTRRGVCPDELRRRIVGLIRSEAGPG